MAGEKQMVPGFNHNVKHKGTPYHVQTEDSGIDNPRIITHLFVGGNVIASKKTSYADIVGAENLAQVVRELMEEQHKEMLRNLISGVYDDTDEELAAKARAFQPGQIVPEPVPEPERAAPGAEAERPAAASPSRPAPAARPPAPSAAAPLPAGAGGKPARPPPIPRSPAQHPKQGPTLAVAPPERRIAAPAQPSPGPARAPRPAPAQRSAAPAAALAAAPASARASAQPRDSVEALFGEDLISEKSLDEVILSYLAEDLAGKG